MLEVKSNFLFELSLSSILETHFCAFLYIFFAYVQKYEEIKHDNRTCRLSKESEVEISPATQS